MSKEQFWTLNVVGGVCALLLLINLILGRLNDQSNRQLIENQNRLNHVQQLQTTLQNLAARIAQAGETDPALNNLLARQGITFNKPAGSTQPKP